ncbi:uncharacterized protein LOC129589816 [Paramacrobiotus metropolitanus]|uniref:uncharacterized protein LOC129589816 n=1 Tax=Paramacrobiotus metropolitanus TaxID=2943436 RepID=UPI002445944B|nr:uncharacterized protein LOC129589816 [Paramacrobiotus metropolitanus]
MLFAVILITGVSMTAGSAIDSDNQCWPKGQYTLMSAAEGCPGPSWAKGWTVNYTHKKSIVPPQFVNGTVQGRYVKLNYCSHQINDSSCQGGEEPAAFPPGSYCLFAHGHPPGGIITANCPAGFNWTWVAIDDINGGNLSHGGQLPSGEFFSFATVQYYCCRDDGDADTEIQLPNQKAFLLYPTAVGKTCQQVAGMTVNKTEIFYDTDDDDATTNGAPAAPDFTPPEYSLDTHTGFWGKGLHMAICHYTPVDKKPFVPPRNDTQTKKTAPVCWPDDNFVLYKPTSGCPLNWTTGSIKSTLGPNSTIAADLDAQKISNGTVVNFCNHNANTSTSRCNANNTAHWNPGSYCIFLGKVKEGSSIDKNCPADFQYSWYVVDTVDKNNTDRVKGDIPSGEYYNIASVYYLCCRDDGNVTDPITLPTMDPFFLLTTDQARNKCQAVNGMTAHVRNMFYDTEDVDADYIPASPVPPGPAVFLGSKINKPRAAWGAGANIGVCYYSAVSVPALESGRDELFGLEGHPPA